MLTFKYKLYSSRKNGHLSKMSEEAVCIWNRALALQRRYYSIFGKHIQCSRMKAHFAKRPSRRLLLASTVQEILERQELAFTRFFDKKAKRPPKFKRRKDWLSFVFKNSSGYRLYGNEFIVNKTQKRYKFYYSRPYWGDVKRVQISRSPVGDFYILITTTATPKPREKTHNGASVGMDFGLKTFLTLSDGNTIQYPKFLDKELRSIKRMSRNASKSLSNGGRRALNKKYEQVRNRRSDWQWKTAHSLCRRFDTIYIEDLNLLAMGRMSRWGRKVYDYAFASFVEKLGYVSSKYRVSIRKINRLYPSTKTCSSCGYINKGISLLDREWVCPNCGERLDRDLNAAKNILRQGVVSSKSVRKTNLSAVRGCI